MLNNKLKNSDGQKEYSQANQAAIIEHIEKHDKLELKNHFALGWRTHHALKEEKDVKK